LRAAELCSAALRSKRAEVDAPPWLRLGRDHALESFAFAGESRGGRGDPFEFGSKLHVLWILAYD
jgi:hypothetical protein